MSTAAVDISSNEDHCVWTESTSEETYFVTLQGKWENVQQRIWVTNQDGQRYKINRRNMAIPIEVATIAKGQKRERSEELEFPESPPSSEVLKRLKPATDNLFGISLETEKKKTI